MASDKTQRIDVCFTKKDVTPAPGDYAKPTTKTSVYEEITSPFERKSELVNKKIRSQGKWHHRIKTVPSIPDSR